MPIWKGHLIDQNTHITFFEGGIWFQLELITLKTEMMNER